MPRNYEVTFSAVTVAAAQDLVQVNSPSAGRIFRVKRMWVACGDTSLATGQGLKLRARYLPATLTVGSGGTTGITPSKKDQTDTACSSTTCATNNTTPATTSGTAVVLWAGATHLYAPFEWRFDDPIYVNPATGFVFELLSTVSGTVTLSGGVDFEELG